MKFRIIINGKFTNDIQLKRIIEKYKSNYNLDVRVTWDAGDIKEFIKESEVGYDRIVVVGGDGSLNEAVDGLMRLPDAPELAQIPLGTANDLAISSKVPVDMESAFHFPFTKKTHPVDVIQVNERYVINAASLGQAARVTQNTPEFLKGVVGKYAYSLSGLLAYFDTSNPVPFVDGFDNDEEYLFGYVCNGNACGGGFSVSEDAKIDDGLMDVLLIKKFDLSSVANVTFDLWKNNDNEYIKRYRTDSLYIESKLNLAMSLDGELYSNNKFYFKVLPKALNLVMHEDSELLCRNTSQNKDSQIFTTV